MILNYLSSHYILHCGVFIVSILDDTVQITDFSKSWSLNACLFNTFCDRVGSTYKASLLHAGG